MKRIALTGGIACGKSLVARYLNAAGIETIDADDIAHELIPDPDERQRIAADVFANPAKRRALEARLHPYIQARIDDFFCKPTFPCGQPTLRIAIIPLLFETHWNQNYDIICTVTSSRTTQIERMMVTRGYTRAEAEARIAAQMPVLEKAEKSNYVIENDGSVNELKFKVERFVKWLKN